MIANPSIVTQAKRNGTKSPTMYVKPGGLNLNVDRAVDHIVERTSPAAQRGARELLRLMAAGPWTLTASYHAGDGSPDLTEHFDVDVNRRVYHLRLDRQSSIFEITYRVDKRTVRLGGREPWVFP